MLTIIVVTTYLFIGIIITHLAYFLSSKEDKFIDSNSEFVASCFLWPVISLFFTVAIILDIISPKLDDYRNKLEKIRNSIHETSDD